MFPAHYTNVFIHTLFYLLKYEENTKESDEDIDDIKQVKFLLEENSGKDDAPDGRAGGDHVGVRKRHVLQSVEEDNQVGGAHH